MEENKHSAASAVPKKYAGNPWWTTNTIMIILIAIIFPAILWQKGSAYPILFAIAIIAFIALFYMSYSLQMNYFIIEGKTLKVRNHFNTDELTAIAIEEISDIEIGNTPKGSTALKIVMVNGKKDVFPASSLRKKHWNEFKNDMATAGITVKDNGIVFYNQ